MTISELRDYLAVYVGNGFGNSLVEVCDSRENPLTDAVCINSALFIEEKDEEAIVVLQTG